MKYLIVRFVNSTGKTERCRPVKRNPVSYRLTGGRRSDFK